MDVARGGRDDVEVVEQPFGGGRHRLVARVIGELRVDEAERAHVLVELPEVRRPRAASAARRASGAARRAAGRVLRAARCSGARRRHQSRKPARLWRSTLFIVQQPGRPHSVEDGIDPALARTRCRLGPPKTAGVPGKERHEQLDLSATNRSRRTPIVCCGPGSWPFSPPASGSAFAAASWPAGRPTSGSRARSSAPSGGPGSPASVSASSSAASSSIGSAMASWSSPRSCSTSCPPSSRLRPPRDKRNPPRICSCIWARSSSRWRTARWRRWRTPSSRRCSRTTGPTT